MPKVIKFQGNRIGLVDPELEHKVSSMFVTPTSSNNYGLVLYVGDKVSGYKPGDKVYYQNKPPHIDINGKKVFVIKDEDIVAIIEEAADA